ncbi:hypothetical protein P7K49_004249 [Saguinus oedipus]|uniref:Uncharacterized protein n=1 Tax=Saguinus oedipus TaxID=9490 RepID=A0ABQ9W6V0_SAGOE|nr:hypothetical protein P7K49_004249 [Saguinus oedipus]
MWSLTEEQKEQWEKAYGKLQKETAPGKRNDCGGQQGLADETKRSFYQNFSSALCLSLPHPKLKIGTNDEEQGPMAGEVGASPQHMERAQKQQTDPGMSLCKHPCQDRFGGSYTTPIHESEQKRQGNVSFPIAGKGIIPDQTPPPDKSTS